jgi:hypothetical protein
METPDGKEIQNPECTVEHTIKILRRYYEGIAVNYGGNDHGNIRIFSYFR